MEIKTFDPERVWQRMLEDPEFAQQTPEGTPRELWRELIGQLPEALGEKVLAAPLTAESFLQVRLAVAKHFVATGFPGKLIRSFPDDFSGFLVFGKEELASQADSLYPKFIEMVTPIAADVPAFLTGNGISEKTFLRHSRGANLEDEPFLAWRAGNLTVAGLFLAQPRSFLDFSG